jgi:hypothetical protein
MQWSGVYNKLIKTKGVVFNYNLYAITMYVYT